MSKTVLSTNISHEDKNKKLLKQMRLDAVRRIKHAGSPRLAASMSALFCLAAKTDSPGTCKLDPNVFVTKIMNDESRNCHQHHTSKKPLPQIIIPADQSIGLVDKIERKWGRLKHLFCAPFWQYIVKNLFTRIDVYVTFWICRIHSI